MKTIPHGKGLPLLGFLPEFRKDNFAMDKRLVEKHGNICSYNLGPNKIVLLAQPDYIKHVLQENYLNYKKDYFYDELKLALGQGLVTSEGDFCATNVNSSNRRFTVTKSLNLLRSWKGRLKAWLENGRIMKGTTPLLI